jgi:glycosyltransferase involved in cell wall biosynthesis
MIIGGMLVRNEADRWLREACEQLKTMCDISFILDDHSTDNTLEVLREYPFIVRKSSRQWWHIDELKQRKILFSSLWSLAKVGDILLILDADELIPDPEKVRVVLQENTAANSFGFALYDMWGDTQYRNDQYWNGHQRSWVMGIRKQAGMTVFKWNEQSLHCGRFPLNLNIQPMYVQGLRIKHMGWSTQKDREEKYKRYMASDPLGKYGIMAQYLSILDPDPNLEDFING